MDQEQAGVWRAALVVLMRNHMAEIERAILAGDQIGALEAAQDARREMEEIAGA